MKKLWVLLAITALVALFSTCSLLPKVSIDDCINNFMNDLNSSDRSNLYTTLDPKSTQYGADVSSAHWDTVFPTSDQPYSLSGQSTNGNQVTATIVSATLLNNPITFDMVTDSSGNYLIHAITITGYTPSNVYF